MQPEQDIREASHDAAGCAPAADGGADSSNRPWETESLRIPARGAVPRLGLLAIGAAALLSLTDLALLGAPAGGGGLDGHEQLAAMPRWRLVAAHYLGVLLPPAYIAGYWLVFRGLRDAGPWHSWPVLLLGSYAAALAGVRHGLLALRAVVVGQDGGAAAQQLLAETRAFVDPLHALVSTLVALTSLWLVAAVLSGRTRLPRWMALANPLVPTLLFALPALLAPGAGFGRLTAASYDLGHLVFFCLVTAVLRGADRAGRHA